MGRRLPSVRLAALLRRLTVALAVGAAGCASSSAVTRVVAGRRIEGRFIASEAYAAYVNGVVLETSGRLEAARASYEEAIRRDPQSVELWTRLGALRCRRSSRDPSPPEAARGGADFQSGGAWDAFARAAEIDESYEELWTERARCHLQRGELGAAESDAARGVSADPDRVEPVLTLVMVLEREKRFDDAKRWLSGLIVRQPPSLDAAEAAYAFAVRTQDVPLRDAARRALAATRPERSVPSPADVDAALLRNEFDVARRLAMAARLSSGSLALRAAALGRASFARSEADLVLGADPSDTDARVAAIAAADLSRDGAALARAVSGLPDAPLPLSPLAALVLSEVLRRRIGDDAARPMREMAGAAEKSDDALVRAVAARK
ncbi:MAG TPA: tetratricopeptide repeat protein [Polyangiaceae bacterium]